MFDDLEQVDWAGLRVEQAPDWIRGLASNDSSVRNDSFDALKDSHFYEDPDFALVVVPYILRIIEHHEVNSETELLIELLRHLRGNARAFIDQNLAVESATTIIHDINNSIGIYRSLSENPLAKDAALHLISDIENR